MPEQTNIHKKFIFPKKFNKVASIVFILGIGSGIIITAQWRIKPLRVSNPVVPYVALVDTRDELTREQEYLKKQISDLQEQTKLDQNNLKKQAQSKSKVEELERYKDAVGLSDVKGSGVIITMDDSHTSPASVDSITHAADLRDLINFLWNEGAIAIAVNGERIVINTSIDCIVNTILINNTKTTAPFSVSVVGDSDKLVQSLESEDNLKDIKKRIDSEGLIFEITNTRNITIPIFDGSIQVKYAKVAE